MAEPSVRVIRAPNKTKKIMIGANHHFFRIFKKLQNSIIIDIFDIITSINLLIITQGEKG
jgi:hypothetical protein